MFDSKLEFAKIFDQINIIDKNCILPTRVKSGFWPNSGRTPTIVIFVKKN